MEVFVKDIVDSMTVDVGENLVFDMDLVSLYWECPLRHPLDHPCTCDFDRFLAEISNNSTPLAMEIQTRAKRVGNVSEH
jgi:hypothetical protein